LVVEAAERLLPLDAGERRGATLLDAVDTGQRRTHDEITTYQCA
jgi:hypothetical protein